MELKLRCIRNEYPTNRMEYNIGGIYVVTENGLVENDGNIIPSCVDEGLDLESINKWYDSCGIEFELVEKVTGLINFSTKELLAELSKREGVREINLKQEGMARLQEVTFYGETLNMKLESGAIILEVID